MLSWEAAQLLSVALSAADTAAAIMALEGYSYEGARGGSTVDASTHQVIAPIYEALVTKDQTTGNCQLAIGSGYAQSAQARAKHEQMVADFDGKATSWFNAYGCLES